MTAAEQAMGMKGVSDAPQISLSHVSYAYDDVPALDDVSFEVSRGELVALTGPNGCGKSTLLRILCGLEFASAGEYRFGGELVDKRAMADRLFAKRLHQRLGFVFQNPDTQLFCPNVREEVEFGPRQMGLPAEEVKRRAGDAMALLGIEALGPRAPYRLSGGEKRKVSIACIVSMNPDALVLDEPCNGLDEDSADSLLSFLAAFAAAGKTVLVTTHRRDEIAALRAREVVMDKHHRIVSA